MPTINYVFSSTGTERVKRALETIGNASKKTSKQMTDAELRTSQIVKRLNDDRVRDARKAAAKIVNLSKKEQAAKARYAQIERQLRAQEQMGIRKVANALKSKLGIQKNAAQQAQVIHARAMQQMRRETIAANQLAAARGRAGVAGAGGSGLGRVRSLSGGTGLIGLGATAALGAAAMTGAATRRALSVDEQITMLAIKGRRPGQGINTQTMKDRIYEASVAQGVDASELTKGLRAFVGKTGNLPGAMKMTDTFAKFISLGTAGSDIGKSAAFLQMKFGIKPEEMDQAMSTLAVGGKRHQFEIEDFAKEMPKMASAMKRFNFKNVGFGAVAQMGAFAQLAAQGTRGGAQAGTAFENILADLLGNAEKVRSVEQGLGVDVYKRGKGGEKTGEMRNFQDIILDVLAASGGAVLGEGKKGKAGFKIGLTDIFKRRSIRGMSAISEKFSGFMEEGQKRGLSQEEIVTNARARMEEFLFNMQDTGNALAETTQDAALAQQSASNRLKSSWAAIEEAAMNSMVPLIAGVASELPRLVDAAKLVVTAFQLLGKAIMPFLKLLPQSGESKLAEARVKKGANEQEMQEITEDLRLKSQGKLHMTAAQEKAAINRLNVLSEETYGATGGTKRLKGETELEFEKRMIETGPLAVRERLLKQQISGARRGLLTGTDPTTGKKVEVADPTDLRKKDGSFDYAKAYAVRSEARKFDAYDIAHMGAALNPVLGILGMMGQAEALQTEFGKRKGYDADEGDFSISLPGRETAQEKATLAKVYAEEKSAAKDLLNAAKALSKSAQELSASSKPTAHPGMKIQ